jgi:hypothetical protein
MSISEIPPKLKRLSTNMTPQVENSTSDLMWQVKVKTQANKHAV